MMGRGHKGKEVRKERWRRKIWSQNGRSTYVLEVRKLLGPWQTPPPSTWCDLGKQDKIYISRIAHCGRKSVEDGGVAILTDPKRFQGVLSGALLDLAGMEAKRIGIVLVGSSLKIEADIALSSTICERMIWALSHRFDLVGIYLKVDGGAPWRCTTRVFAEKHRGTGVENIDNAEDRRMTVRLIEKSEGNVEAMLRIDREAFGEPLLNNWVLPPFIRYGRSFGLFENGSMVGFTLFLRSWNEPNVAYMEALAIDGKHQGKGYARYLLSESLRHLKENAFSFAVLTVDPKNSKALHIYQDIFGFQLAEHRKDEYGKGRDRYLLRLDLNERTGLEL